MESMRPPLAAIFFMTYFHRARGGHGPLGPPLDPLLRILDYAVNVVKFMLYLSYLHMHSHTYTHTHRQTEQTHVTYLSVGPDFSGCTCCLSPATTWCTGCCCGFACCLDGRIFSYSLFVARRRLTSFQAQ